MIKNVLYAFRYDPARMRKAFLWEWLHGTLLAIPSGILLFVVWELMDAQPDEQAIWWTVAGMGVLFFVQLFVANKAMISSNRGTYMVSRAMRLSLGNKLQRLSLGYYKKRDPGDLASVLLQDAANFENIFGHSITNIANALFGTLVLSLFLFWLDWRLAVCLIGALLFAAPLVRLSGWLVHKYGTSHIKARNTTTARFLEYVLGIQHIKSYGMTGERFQSLDIALKKLRRESIKTEAIPGPVVLTAGVFFELFFLIMIWLGLYLLTGGELTIQVMVAFLILGYRLYEPMKILLIEYPMLSYMNVSLTRMIEVLEAEEQAQGRGLTANTFDIRFDEVHFAYHDEKKVLNGISFHAEVGTMTALVGPSGSGKTTITSLVARFWDVDQGSISIGGIDLRDMAPQTVYGLISEVFQEVYLFDDTIYENIRIGRLEVSEAEILEVAEQAQLMEFVNEMPEGLHTRVGEGGNKLSGGQKQRISIARALLKDAPIILLDEATASLDPENEIYIQRAIQELVRDKTVLVIAHKLASIRQADQILVLDQGQIIEQGTHDALLKQAGLYANFWETQRRTSGWKIEHDHERARSTNRTGEAAEQSKSVS
ncbi:MAG: ABC transporter ATP-binding protein [Bacteroidota bacterium]